MQLLYSSDLLDVFPDYFLIKNNNNAKTFAVIIINLIMNLCPVDSDKLEGHEFL